MENIMKNTGMRKIIDRYGTSFFAYGGLLFCIILFTLLPPRFGESIWTGAKLSTLMSDVIVIGLLSVGSTFIYAMGGMDISIGKQVGLYATLMVVLGNSTGSLLPGILLSLLISLVIGFINGATGEALKIHPIVSSLVVMMVLGGVSNITYNTLGSRNVALRTIDYRVFKNPWIMFAVLILEIAIITYLFRFTKYGKYARAIGANPLAAKQSGINLIKYKVIAYMFLSVCIVTASIFQMGYTGSASDSTGTGFEMNVLVALILGGMPLSGGMKSRVSSAVVGALTFSLLNVGLPLIGVKPNQVFIIKATIFLVVVLITTRKSRGTLPR